MDINIIEKIKGLLTSTPQKVKISQYILTFMVMLYLIMQTFPDIKYLYLAILVYFIQGCMGVTAFNHRSLSHKSWIPCKPLEYFSAIAASLGGTSSPINWVTTHIAHHKHSDTELDPHTPKHKGRKIFHSILLNDYNLSGLSRPPYFMLKNKFYVFLYKYYYGILFSWAALLYLIDPLLFWWAWAIPATIQVWVSTGNNWVTHKNWGYTRYKTKDNSKNIWWFPFAWGDAWHNNHHAEPWTYSFSRKWYEIDITGIYIWLMIKLGLATKGIKWS